MEKTHVAISGSERVSLPGAVALGRTHPNTPIDLTLKLRRRSPLPEVSAKVNPPLSRADFLARYGASQGDVDELRAILSPLGIKVEAANLAARSVQISAPVFALEKAFGVTLVNYRHASGNYRGRIGPIYVPGAIAGLVEGVFGFDTRCSVRRRRQPVRTGQTARDLSATSIPSAWYKPAELATHYQFPPGDGSGETVGILEFGGGYFPSDLQNFCTLCGIAPLPSVTTVSTDGTSTSAKDGAEGEVMLDIEVVAGVCPRAQIVAYFAKFTVQGWIAAMDAAIHDQTRQPGVISVSWGYAEHEYVWTKQAMTQVSQLLLDAAHLGITVCVAAGDDGSSDAITDGHAYVDFPSSSPYALAVGGTTIPVKGGAGPDIVWKEGDGLRSDNGGSTGGGVSTMFAKPTWQAGVNIASVNPHAIKGRVVPDLAANADWNASPYLLAVDGNVEGNGGTSAATPLVAALITLINAGKTAAGMSRVGFLTPQLYAAAPNAPAGSATIGTLACTDITQGGNTTAHLGGYSAGAGFDAASGWGTPNGVKLAQLLP